MRKQKPPKKELRPFCFPTSTLGEKIEELATAVKAVLEVIDGCFDKIDWCVAFKYEEKAPGGGSWRDFIHNTHGKDATGLTLEGYKSKFGDDNPHGHHIVLKKGFKDCSEPARRILCRWGIDPYTGRENLVFSPNRCHSKNYARRVLKELNEVKSLGRSAVVAKLRELAGVHRKCTESGSVDPKTDELSGSEEAC